MANAPDMSKFIGTFKDEANELLLSLDQKLLALEENPNDAAALKEMTRIAHTVKGSARLVGLNGISEIAHEMEEIFGLCRDGAVKVDAVVGDVLFKCLDAIKLLVDSAGGAPPSDVDVGAICRELKETKEAALRDAAEPETPAAQKSEPAEQLDEQDAEALTAPATSVTGDEPIADQLPQAPEPVTATTEESGGKETLDIPPRTADEGKTPSEKGDRPSEPASSQPRAIETIRVETAKLDEFANLVGEMQINQKKFEEVNKLVKDLVASTRDQAKLWARIRDRIHRVAGVQTMIQQKGDSAATSLGDALAGKVEATPEEALASRIPKELLDDVNAYDEASETVQEKLVLLAKAHNDDVVRLRVTTGQLQDSALSVRMLPVSFVFDAFPRAVRDMARESGKKINLIIEGGETELDKKVLEEIREPLLHLMRNAVDHGIEQVDVRKRLGKPEEGTIKLSASHEGDHVFIEVSDDGCGIDIEQLKRAAIQQGIVDEAQVREMNDRQALYLIFESGFSTSSSVTQISGRGMGMDIIKRSIDDLKGEVRVESRVGAGTTVTLSLPLTLVIIRVLLVSVSGQTFAIPTISVETTTKTQRSNIKSVESKQAIVVRNRTVPVLPLSELLQLGPNGDGREEDGLDGRMSVVIVNYAEDQIGFIVDELIGEQEIVLKSLPEPFPRVPKVAGAAIMGSGDIVNILHIPDLFSAARMASKPVAPKVETEAPTTGEDADSETKAPRLILVVEDSLTTRELERSILMAAGYDVDVASDGIEGLEKVNEKAFDLIIADVQMPRMDGFEMTQRLKQDDRHKDIPVIMLTTLESDEDKKRGLEVGAEAYMVKSTFDQTALLETIQRLIG